MIVLMTFQVDSPGTVLISTLLDILALDILGLDILGRFPELFPSPHTHVQADHQSAVLSGAASPSSYAAALGQVRYNYTRMESILESAVAGNDPDFTPR